MAWPRMNSTPQRQSSNNEMERSIFTFLCREFCPSSHPAWTMEEWEREREVLAKSHCKRFVQTAPFCSRHVGSVPEPLYPSTQKLITQRHSAVICSKIRGLLRGFWLEENHSVLQKNDSQLFLLLRPDSRRYSQRKIGSKRTLFVCDTWVLQDDNSSSVHERDNKRQPK